MACCHPRGHQARCCSASFAAVSVADRLNLIIVVAITLLGGDDCCWCLELVLMLDSPSFNYFLTISLWWQRLLHAEIAAFINVAVTAAVPLLSPRPG